MNSDDQNIEIDDVKYAVSDLSEGAQKQLANIKFVDTQIQQLRNEWAVADTARIAYEAALKKEINLQSNDT